MALTVAVTGPTGEIGTSAVDALDQHPEVERIIGMARRPFDPATRGWGKTEYRQGDILDRDAVDALVADATWWSISPSSSWGRGRKARA